MSRRFQGALGALLIVVAVLLLLRSPAPNPPPSGSGDLKSGPSPDRAFSPLQNPASALQSAPGPVLPTDREKSLTLLRASFQRVLKTLASADPEKSESALASLDEDLHRFPAEISVAAITEFLRSGKDAGTGMPFILGEGGVLETAPSLRVFLLDRLGSLATAANLDGVSLGYARELLQSKGSADEWAIALRNVAWADPQSGEFIKAKTREMLANEPWRTAPSDGMSEAFDFIVFTRDLTMIPVLAASLDQADSPLSRASFVALTRLSESAPLEVFEFLNTNPDLLKNAPLARADFYAKGQVSDPAQVQAIETYLARPDVSAEERSKFVDSLVVPGTFVSNNLLTVSPQFVDDPAVRLPELQKWVNVLSARFPQVSRELAQKILVVFPK